MDLDRMPCIRKPLDDLPSSFTHHAIADMRLHEESRLDSSGLENPVDPQGAVIGINSRVMRTVVEGQDDDNLSRRLFFLAGGRRRAHGGCSGITGAWARRP